MAKNIDIIAEITALATEKNIDVPVTEGLNNAQLAAMLKELKGPAAPGPAPAPGTGDEATGDADNTKADDEDEDEDEVDEVKRPPYYISANKSITSLAGSLAEGDEVKPEYVGGMQRIKELIKLGLVSKG